MNITKEEMAARLTGREYGSEIIREECLLAKQSGLFVIFGYSDDSVEIRGVEDDEISAYEGVAFLLSRAGVVPEPDREEEEVLEKFKVLEHVKKAGRAVEALWSKDGYSWIYRTEIPHATFEIVEYDSKYCRGIVISIADLPT